MFLCIFKQLHCIKWVSCFLSPTTCYTTVQAWRGYYRQHVATYTSMSPGWKHVRISVINHFMSFTEQLYDLLVDFVNDNTTGRLAPVQVPGDLVQHCEWASGPNPLIHPMNHV